MSDKDKFIFLMAFGSILFLAFIFYVISYYIYTLYDCKTLSGVYVQGVCITQNTIKDYRP